MKRWHQGGICIQCVQNEQRARPGSTHVPAPSQHQFATQPTVEQQAERRRRWEKIYSKEYVYLLTDATGLYKIGRVPNLRRLKERVTGRTRAPSLRIVGYIKTTYSVGLETQIHNELADYRVIGEWFRLDLGDPGWKYWWEAFHQDIDQDLIDEINRDAFRGTELDSCWQLLRRTDLGGISYETATHCARMIAQVIPQAYRTGKMISDLGEVLACTLLHLTRMPQGQRGYDAIDEKGSVDAQGLKYQIKTRSPEGGDRVDDHGTVGRFSNLDFDEALLVLLDRDLQIDELYLADTQVIQGQLRAGRNDIAIHRFKSIGRRLQV
jgi:hypothetical protein